MHTFRAVVWFALIGVTYTGWSLAQVQIPTASDVENEYGNLIIGRAETWRISSEAPIVIQDGFSLQRYAQKHTLHRDTLREALGESTYGWAELAIEIDSSYANRTWLLRNFGFGALKVWVNGELLLQSGNPSPISSEERLSSSNFLDHVPVTVRTGVNYFLVEYSYHTLPDWIDFINSQPNLYVSPILTDPEYVVNQVESDKIRAFILGSVLFVLFILIIAHYFLSLKSINNYHKFAMWANFFLFAHAFILLGDSIFYWTSSVLPISHFSMVSLFLFVFYFMIRTISSYYDINISVKSLNGFLLLFIILSILSLIYNYKLVLLLHPLLSVMNICFSLFLLSKVVRNNKKYRAVFMFSGYVAMLIGTLMYTTIYLFLFRENYFIYYVSVMLVYTSVPLAFSITIILDFIDIFDKTEQTVQERTKELRDKDEYKNRFLANVSHELRTPLTILNGLISKSMNNSDKDGKIMMQNNDASNILRNTRRLTNLVTQILELSKSDEKKQIINNNTFVIDDLVNNVINLNLSYVSLRHQEVLFESATKSVVVRADEEKVATILTNLLVNASKFGPEYSLIRVESRINLEDSHLEIDVKDEGRGVAEEDREVIFERFHRLKSPDQPYVEGLGIGLELSRTFARLQGGDLCVVEDGERGARLRLTLPIEKNVEWGIPPRSIVHEQTQDQSLAHIYKSSSPHKKVLHILLVEDNPDLNAYMVDLLQPLGAVHACKNGAEAWVWLKQPDLTVDLVVTDLMMPLMSGEQLISKMSEDDKLRSIPVIVLSAKDNFENRLNLLRVGIVDYISKPFNADEIVLKIYNLLRFYSNRQRYSVEIDTLDLPHEPSLSDKVKQYIISHIEDPFLSPASLAEEFAMSERSFYRKIEKDSGLTPAAFIREVRLQYAIKLMQGSSQLRLTDVAQKVGYKSVDTFKRNYSERFGVNLK